MLIMIAIGLLLKRVDVLGSKHFEQSCLTQQLGFGKKRLVNKLFSLQLQSIVRARQKE